MTAFLCHKCKRMYDDPEVALDCCKLDTVPAHQCDICGTIYKEPKYCPHLKGQPDPD